MKENETAGTLDSNQNKESVLTEISSAQQINLDDINKEHVTKGAILQCLYGSKSCILNLSNSHGYYANNQPLVDVQDSGLNNISGFGVCRKTEQKCSPNLSAWQNGDEKTVIWDVSTLKNEATVLMNKSFCTCYSNGGTIKAISSGQPISTHQDADVYITDDRKAIMVEDIRYDIYNPYESTNTDTWYTLMPYEMTEVEFSLSQALLGIELTTTDYSRSKLITYSNQSVQYGNGKQVNKSVTDTYIAGDPSAGSKAANTTLVSAGIEITVNILRNFAEAITYTTLYFYFQKSESGNHRVIIMGGTNSDYWKFLNYGYYNMYRSYLHDIVPKNLQEITKEGMKESVKVLIEKYQEMISECTSRAKIFVEESELCLKEKEYYDLVVYLVPKRSSKKHQVYLYEDQGNIHQKYITWPGESLAIVKRKGFYPFDNITKLIELIDDTGTTEGNFKFWEIFDKVLKENYKTAKERVADPSNAIYSIANLVDEIPSGTTPESAYYLENING